MSLVSLVKTDSLHPEALKAAIKKSLSLVEFVPDKGTESIAIKPNLCYYNHPSTGEVTDPQFVGALIDVLREQIPTDPKIFVVESDASAMVCKYAFKTLGYETLAADKDVALVNLAKTRNRTCDVKVNGWFLRFRIPNILLESDLLVNVPKLKYMQMVRMTCAMKNIFGCNAFRKKSIYHIALDEAIVGINKLIKTDLTVVDGIIVRGKVTKKLGLIMAGKDPVAVDALASRIMGFNQSSVRQIMLALKSGIGEMGYKAVGEPVSHFEKAFPRLTMRDNVRSKLYSVSTRFLGNY